MEVSGGMCLECRAPVRVPRGMWHGVHLIAVVSPEGRAPSSNYTMPGSPSQPS